MVVVGRNRAAVELREAEGMSDALPSRENGLLKRLCHAGGPHSLAIFFFFFSFASRSVVLSLSQLLFRDLLSIPLWLS
jgi:hypothetical protein